MSSSFRFGRKIAHIVGMAKPPAKKIAIADDEACVTAQLPSEGSYPFLSPLKSSAKYGYHDEQTQQSIVQLRHSVIERKNYHHQTSEHSHNPKLSLHSWKHWRVTSADLRFTQVRRLWSLRAFRHSLQLGPAFVTFLASAT